MSLPFNPAGRFDSLLKCYAVLDRRRDGTWFSRATPLDWEVLKRQMLAESGGDPDAVSPVGAKGLTQFMDATWKEWEANEFGPDIPQNRHVSAFDPEDSIRAQADVMAWLLCVFKGDAAKALAAFNWGIGNVQRCLAKHGDQWREFLPLETTRYLEKIL